MACLRPVILLLSMLALTAVAAAQDCYEYRHTFRVAEPFPLTGSVAAMTGDQDRVLAARGNDLLILDAVEPAAVALLGIQSLGEAPLLIASDGYLAAVASDNSLMLVDWSDPAAPQVTVAMALPVGTHSLWSRDGLLLVSRGAAGVDLYDVSDPHAFNYLGNVPTSAAALEAVMHEGWLVVAASSSLLSVDIADLGAPMIADTYVDYQVSIGERDVRRVQSEGDFLVVAAIRWHGGQYGGPTEGLDLMTIDHAGQFTCEESMYYYGWPEYVAAGGLLHSSDEQSYTVSALSDFPEVAASHEPVSPDAGLLAAGSATALHWLGADELGVYDLRHPFFLSPDPAWSGPDFNDIPRGEIEPGWLLKSKTVWSGMFFSYYAYLYDVRDPQAVVERIEYQYSGDSDNFATASICASDAERVIVRVETAYGGGCRLSDLRTGSEIVTWLPYSGPAILAGDRIYQVTGDWDSPAGVACLDVSTPGDVTEIGFFPVSAIGLTVVLDETNVMVRQRTGMKVVDFADPSQPAVRGTLPGVSGRFLERSGDRLYLADGSGHLAAMDIGDLDALSLVWESPDLGWAITAFELSGDLAAIAVNAVLDDMLRIYDLGDDAAGPVPVSPFFATGTYHHGILWDGTFLYTTDLRVYDVADPTAPVLLGRGTGAHGDLYRQGDCIVTSGGVFPVQCVVTGVDEHETIPEVAADLGLRVAPNPFNPRTTVSFVAPLDGEVRLSLYDLAGRRVRVLLHTTVIAGRHEVNWDACDDRGRSQASGVYFARLEAGSRQDTAKLVLVR